MLARQRAGAQLRGRLAALVVAALLFYFAHVGRHPGWALGSAAAGVLLMGLFHAGHGAFGRPEPAEVPVRYPPSELDHEGLREVRVEIPRAVARPGMEETRVVPIVTWWVVCACPHSQYPRAALGDQRLQVRSDHVRPGVSGLASGPVQGCNVGQNACRRSSSRSRRGQAPQLPSMNERAWRYSSLVSRKVSGRSPSRMSSTP